MCYFQYSDTQECILIFQVLLLSLPLRAEWGVELCSFLTHRSVSFHRPMKKRPESELFQPKGPTTSWCKKKQQLWVCCPGTGTAAGKAGPPQLPAQNTHLWPDQGDFQEMNPGFGLIKCHRKLDSLAVSLINILLIVFLSRGQAIWLSHLRRMHWGLCEPRHVPVLKGTVMKTA